MLHRTLTAACLLAFSAAPAWATDWTVDPAKSRLGFTFTQEGKEIVGQFDEWTADITFDANDLANASASVTIVIDSIDAGSRSRSRRARGSTWFNESDFSTATFETTAFRQTGPDAFEADATLTIRGQSNPITLPFTLSFDGDQVKMDGSVSFDRTSFGVGQGEYTSGDTIGTSVVVDVDLLANRAE